jgi:aminoglycoside phosphotransferase (APT) family kinase protein
MPTVVDRDLALIRDPESITPEWLTTVLRAEGSLLTTETVTSLRSTLIGEGVGVLSRIYRVEPTYSQSVSGPSSLIVKIATDNEVYRFTADVLSAFRREMVFYAELAHTAPFVTPRCFAAVQATENSDFTLVMEDLAGRRFQDQLDGSTWDDTLAAIRAIASFHAAWMDKVHPYPDLYLPLDNEGYRALLPMLFDQNWPAAQEVFAQLITPDIKAFGDTWSQHIDFMLSALNAPYTTLAHGDWRADNVLFDAEDGSVVGIDFQLLGVGCGTYDVAYYVSQSVDSHERAGRDRDLVEVYVDALRSHGIDADFETAWRQYRVGLLFCLSYPVNGGLAYDALPDRGKRLMKSMFARASTAITDTNALDVLPSGHI